MDPVAAACRIIRWRGKALARKISVSEIKKLRRAGKLRGPKYDFKQTQPAELRQTLSESDTKEVARLVHKYGRDFIAAAAQKVPLRGPGRPSRGFLPYYERMALADEIEELAEEHRQAGSRKPYTDAEIDFYELEYAGEKNPPVKNAETTPHPSYWPLAS